MILPVLACPGSKVMAVCALLLKPAVRSGALAEPEFQAAEDLYVPSRQTVPSALRLSLCRNRDGGSGVAPPVSSFTVPEIVPFPDRAHGVQWLG